MGGTWSRGVRTDPLAELGLEWDGRFMTAISGEEGRLVLKCNAAREHAEARGYTEEVELWRATLRNTEAHARRRSALEHAGVAGGMVTAIGSEGQRSVMGSDGRVRRLGPRPSIAPGLGGDRRDDEGRAHCVVS